MGVELVQDIIVTGGFLLGIWSETVSSLLCTKPVYLSFTVTHKSLLPLNCHLFCVTFWFESSIVLSFLGLLCRHLWQNRGYEFQFSDSDFFLLLRQQYLLYLAKLNVFRAICHSESAICVTSWIYENSSLTASLHLLNHLLQLLLLAECCDN